MPCAPGRGEEEWSRKLALRGKARDLRDRFPHLGPLEGTQVQQLPTRAPVVFCTPQAQNNTGPKALLKKKKKRSMKRNRKN